MFTTAREADVAATSGGWRRRQGFLVDTSDIVVALPEHGVFLRPKFFKTHLYSIPILIHLLFKLEPPLEHPFIFLPKHGHLLDHYLLEWFDLHKTESLFLGTFVFAFACLSPPLNLIKDLVDV